jgi:hypothetical protein
VPRITVRPDPTQVLCMRVLADGWQNSRAAAVACCRLQKILKELLKSCQGADGDDDPKKGTQLLEVYALEIQMHTGAPHARRTHGAWRTHGARTPRTSHAQVRPPSTRRTSCGLVRVAPTRGHVDLSLSLSPSHPLSLSRPLSDQEQ